jgi:methionyl aminopeptidase
MTVLKKNEEIEKLRESGSVIKVIFEFIKGYLKEGITTLEIDQEVEKIILDMGAEPAFKGYKGYPSSICASVNEVVVHGIPSESVVLKNGDIISIDIGVKKNGLFADSAKTFAIGDISLEAKKLIDVTERSLAAGIEKAVAGNRLYDISNAVEETVKVEGFSEVRSFVGHGIGYKLHEPPEVPNFGQKGKGPVLEEGLLLAIEPMVNIGTREVDILEDGWTAVTKDGKLSAHFEHTVIVGKHKAEAVT